MVVFPRHLLHEPVGPATFSRFLQHSAISWNCAVSFSRILGIVLRIRHMVGVKLINPQQAASVSMQGSKG